MRWPALFRRAQPVSAALAPRLPAQLRDLRDILRPQAVQRWILPQLASITPTYIESTLRGALTGSHVQTWELFDLMEETWPRLAKNLNEIKRAVIGLDWKLNPWAEEDMAPTPSADERCKLVSSACWRMRPDPAGDENNFESTLYDVLDAWAKGVSVLEIAWELRPAGKLGDITAPRATTWVHPSAYGWSTSGRLALNASLFDARRNQSYLRGFQQDDLTEFPPDKFLIAVSKAKTSFAPGAALLRPLAWWWCASNFGADWLLNLAQLFGLPFRWATYDVGANQTTINAICDMLENMGSAAWGAFPAGTTMELKDAARTGDNSPQADLLDRADKNCDLLILGQTLTTEQGDRGSQALGKVHEGVREDVIQSAADFAAGVINGQLVSAILRLNYGDDEEAPEFCPCPHETKDQLANAQRDLALQQMGFTLPKDWAYKRHDVPLPQANEETLEAPRAVSMPGTPADDTGDSEDEEQQDDEPAAEDNQEMKAKAARHEDRALEQLIERGLEELSAVQARWVAGVKPFYRELLAKAADETVSDADLEKFLTRAVAQYPELFDKLDTQALAGHMEAMMGAACINGALRGYMARASAVDRARKAKGK